MATDTEKISQLKSSVANLNQISESEKTGFVSLVSRYLRSSKMASHVVGYPRIGDLQKVAADLRKSIWKQCWGFDTNYHFIVPELGPDVKFSYASHKAVTEYKEAKALGVDTVPVLVGPVSYLLLSKPAKDVEESFSLLSLLGKILPIYKEVITELKEAGASWIQFDEPTLVMDLESHKLHAFTEAYSALESTLSGLNVLIETYFADIPAEQYKTLTSLKGVTAFGFDLVRGSKTLDLIKGDFPEGKYLYDIHSPRIPSTEEMLAVLETNILWVNPDCGLKTRKYTEVKPALMNMVNAAKLPKPMMVKIMVNSHEYIALIDTGSHLNFLHPRVAGEVGLKIINDDPIEVRIADGSIMCSEGRCPEFEFVIQGGQFATQAYILQVDGCDVILGIQWLIGLGQIKNWDFASLKMELTQGDKTIQIKGMDTEESEVGCSTDEIADGINMMRAVLETIQVNPDGGLKTRKYTEVKPTLKNKRLRSQLVSAN